MSRLAAAHRALAALYEMGAEATVDHLLAEAERLAVRPVRSFWRVDALGRRWLVAGPLPLEGADSPRRLFIVLE